MKYAVVLAIVSLAACSTIHAGLGPSYSAGSVSVSGTETGIGGGAEIGASKPMLGGELGVLATVDLAGYSGANDGDPILWATGSIRYRRYLAEPTAALRPFYAVGAGAGTDRDTRYLVLEGFGELGLRYALSPSLGLTLGLRDRPAAFIGSGDPAVEPNNTLQLMGALELVLGDSE